jgi:hypothetical protein
VPTGTSSGRRTALANWIASPSNPLTARVFANRVWNNYFGRGLVDTVNDFGKMGQKPVNPALLDYLADSFVKNGWSVKKLQKEILLSSVYRQSSDHREDLVSVDPEDKLLAYFPRQRLDAEQVRDSLLYAAGLLEEKIGGPSVFRRCRSISTTATRGRSPTVWPTSIAAAPTSSCAATRRIRCSTPSTGPTRSWSMAAAKSPPLPRRRWPWSIATWSSSGPRHWPAG